MRTRFEIVLADEADPAHLRAAGEEALDEIEQVERRLSAYRPDSDLSYVNAGAARGPIPIDGALFEFLRRAAALHDQTDGAFDLTVGPLLRCWGFATGGAPAATVPEAAEIERALALVGQRRNVLLDQRAGTVRFARPGVRLDPGAIGKGYGIERAAEILRDIGIQSALLHGGTSTICAIGAPPGGDAWQIAVQHPLQALAHLAMVGLRDRALSVSAVHGKSFRAEGRRFGHVLDPRTGRPVEGSVLAAVVAGSATDTDALSTGLLVLGEPGLTLLGERRPDIEMLLAGEDEGGELRVNAVGDSIRRDIDER